MNPNIILHKYDLPDNFEVVGEIAIDTETMGLELIRDKLCLLQLKDTTDTIHLVQFNGNYAAPNLKKILQNKNIVKIFHYARFDVTAIYLYLGVLCENIFCTKIASKLTRTYTSYHGLKDLCKDMLGVELKKEQQLSYWGAENYSEEQKTYAASDVLYLHDLRKELIKRLIAEKRASLAKSCFDFLPTRAVLDTLNWKNETDIFLH